MQKKVLGIHKTANEPVGALSTYRALPTRSLPELDPFLLINHHGLQTFPPRNSGLPFGPHPHKGFETLTFVFEGSVAHKDSTGGVHVTHKGGVQWMTAGKGIVHSEESDDQFKEHGGDLEIIQVWMNLPKSLKLSSPDYQGYEEQDLVHIAGPNGAYEWNIISGSAEGEKGPHESKTDLFMSSLEVNAGETFETEVSPDRNVMLYQVRGASKINGFEVNMREIIEFANEGEAISIQAKEDSLFLFCHGAPINEPVVAHGPFVMNTHEEINEAIFEYQTGKFGNIPA
ncbi:pirin family protein [Sanyastnella coralliicola]|uniref:pirin family protein n=1 Tax=Sanyastnella coralliicola TaxID=3069118 RepID=UPI0027B9DE04|nr:pirin family protein [Longitalea sp. SCSIO 12813]